MPASRPVDTLSTNPNGFTHGPGLHTDSEKELVDFDERDPAAVAATKSQSKIHL